MCGRYYRTKDKQAIAEFFHAEPTGDELLYAPGYNIAPTTIQPVIRQNRVTLTPEAVPMCWGLVGYYSTGPDPKRASFNARAESLEKSGFWARSFSSPPMPDTGQRLL
jgi:putative SOS response-associated peptidase YedK